MSRSAYVAVIMYAGTWAILSMVWGERGHALGHLSSTAAACLFAFLHYGPEDSQKGKP